MIKEALKKFTKKLALALCVSAMCIGGAAVSAQAAESAEVQESGEGQAELALSNATYLNFGQVVNKSLNYNYYTLYEVKISKAGCICLDFIAYNTRFEVYWYDSNSDELDTWYMYSDSSLGFGKYRKYIDLLPGTYYIKVCNHELWSLSGNDGSFKMKATYKCANTNEKEPNNNAMEAMTIKFNSLMKAQIACNDDVDFFKFRVQKKSDVFIKVASSELSGLYWDLYNQNGDKIYSDRISTNDLGKIKTTLEYNLGAGVYYIGVSKRDSSTGSYAFKVVCQTTLGSKNVRLSKTKYEYDGKVKSPAVIVKDNSGRRLVKGRDYDVYAQSGRRNVGIYKVKVVFKGNYKGSAVKTLTIIPARTTITGIANKSNGIKIAWKQRKAANATGYIVYRSVNGGAYKAIKVIRSTRTTAFTDTGANSWWDTYSYKVVVYKNLGGKTYKSVGSNSKSIYRY